MPAADFLSNQQAKAQGVGTGQRVRLLENNELYGTKQVLIAIYRTPSGGFGVNSIGDRLFIGILPRFSRVTGIRLSTEAMGTSATISIGTDAVTYLTTQPAYGQGTGTELVSGLSVASATTTPVEAINVVSTQDSSGLPSSGSLVDRYEVITGLGFETQKGPVALFATSGGATYATLKSLVIVVEFVAQFP